MSWCVTAASFLFLPQAYYYSAIVEDVLLRFAWILTVSATTLTKFDYISDILATVLAPLEVFRYTTSFTFPLFILSFLIFSNSSFHLKGNPTGSL